MALRPDAVTKGARVGTRAPAKKAAVKKAVVKKSAVTKTASTKSVAKKTAAAVAVRADQADPFASLSALSLRSVDERLALAASVLRVRTKCDGLQPLHANAAQRLFEERHVRESIVLKARQMGLSTWVAARFFLRALLVPNTVTVHVAHTREAATALFRTVQRMRENLPDALRERARLKRNNAGEMVFAENDSEIRVVSAAEPNAGRGLTVHHLHCSELSRWQGDAAETLAGLRAALAPGGELVMESTPNGAYGCFYQEWVAAERNGVQRHFFPWWKEPGYVSAAVLEGSLTDEELVLVNGHGLSLEQIGFRRELAERFGPLRAQEFAEDAASCFRESGACVFETKPLLQRMAVLQEPIAARWTGALQVYRPAVAARRYVVAVDPAGGTADGDFAAAQVIDRATGMQCAELQARWSPQLLAARVAELAREYNGALLAVERNNHGHAVLAYLEGERGFDLYRDADGAAGWLTTSANRSAMLAAMQVLVSARSALLSSGRLLQECRSFVERNGRMEAAAGAHDDLVLAMAIAQAVR